MSRGKVYHAAGYDVGRPGISLRVQHGACLVQMQNSCVAAADGMSQYIVLGVNAIHHFDDIIAPGISSGQLVKLLPAYSAGGGQFQHKDLVTRKSCNDKAFVVRLLYRMSP